MKQETNNTPINTTPSDFGEYDILREFSDCLEEILGTLFIPVPVPPQDTENAPEYYDVTWENVQKLSLILKNLSISSQGFKNIDGGHANSVPFTQLSVDGGGSTTIGTAVLTISGGGAFK